MSDLRIVHNISKGTWLADKEVSDIFLCYETRTGNILELEVLSISKRGYYKLLDRIDNSIVWHNPKIFCMQKEQIDILEGG